MLNFLQVTMFVIFVKSDWDVKVFLETIVLNPKAPALAEI